MDMNKTTYINRLKSLQTLNTRNPNFINTDLYKILLKKEVLLTEYKRVKNNQHLASKTETKAHLDANDLDRLSKFAKHLQKESWRPLSSKATDSPKIRNLVIKPIEPHKLEENISQNFIHLILKAIYEPQFCENSLNSKPKQERDKTLDLIKRKSNNITYLVQGHIRGLNIEIKYNKLIELLKKRIKDERFIRLVCKMLRSGYLRKDTSLPCPITNIHQNLIISSVITNIYLYELDLFMEKMISEVTTQNNNISVVMRKVLGKRIRVIREQIEDQSLITNDKIKLISELKRLHVCSLKIRNLTNNIIYTRYSDNFTIGIPDSHELTNRIQREVKYFLSTFNLSSHAQIMNIKKKEGLLNHQIISTSLKVPDTGRSKRKIQYLKETITRVIHIHAPINKIVRTLATKGFCQKNGFPSPKKIWINKKDSQIIQNFNTLTRRLFNLYFDIKKRRYLQRIWYILKFSCAYTLAEKHRTSIRKIFKKHSFRLKVNFGKKGEKKIELYQPLLGGRP
jgi:hypothetical protein